MKKLKVAILWHQHQPYYKYKNEFLLPWVRLHGVKDYYDIPALLHNYPNVKQTFNLAPSLIIQIEDYIQNTCNDIIQRLTRIPVKYLTDENKKEIINKFFTLNENNLIAPNNRFRELYDIAKNNNFAISNFQNHDWIDLQVWYNLAWTGQISRQIPFINRLLKKQRNFTEEEKLLLLDYQNQILKNITSEMFTLKKIGQIDISVSPYQHPILPLLCNSKSALEAMPNIAMPEPIFKYPEDAKNQIEKGIEIYKKYFNSHPIGMWPSEGSLSNEVLEILVKNGIQWVATDEAILSASLKDSYRQQYKYFPFEIDTPSGSITIFFRDHTLSDKIGFEYSCWNSYDAAINFRESLFAIRNDIIHNLGEDALNSAVVPIILDGENCWEFYQDNGIHFLHEFFSMLETSDLLETVLFSESLTLPIPNFLPNLNSIRAGSWINGNFSIWIGHQDDIKGWNYLSKVRELVENQKDNLSPEVLEQVMNEIYIAEGSDWFWWYGPEHDAPNKKDFDTIFRWRIGEIYKILGIEPPTDLIIPITENNISSQDFIIPQIQKSSPQINGSMETIKEWKNSGKLIMKNKNSTMHQINEIISDIHFCYDDNLIYFRIVLLDFISDKYSIEMNFVNKHKQKLKIIFSDGAFSLNSTYNEKFPTVQMTYKNCIDIAVEKQCFENIIYVSIQTIHKEKITKYPQLDYFNISC